MPSLWCSRPGVDDAAIHLVSGRLLDVPAAIEVVGLILRRRRFEQSMSENEPYSDALPSRLVPAAGLVALDFKEAFQPLPREHLAGTDHEEGTAVPAWH